MKRIICHGRRISDRANQFFEFEIEVGSEGNVVVSQFDLVPFYKVNLGERYDKGFIDPWKLLRG